MSITNARPTTRESSHWYYTDGRPCYELPKADGKGMKSPTLADARKLNLVPGVSTILKVLAKPELTNWLIEQAVLAVLTTPRMAGEADDAFVRRVLHVEAQQEQEAAKARDKGSEIHDLLQRLMTGETSEYGDLEAWVKPAHEWMKTNCGAVVATEKILSGFGYAGRTDLVCLRPSTVVVWDFKTSKKLPDPKKGGWLEHKLQLAAYSEAHRLKDYCTTPHTAGNIYISTTDPGKFVVCEYTSAEIEAAYVRGFKPLLTVWQYQNNYQPAYD